MLNFKRKLMKDWRWTRNGWKEKKTQKFSVGGLGGLLNGSRTWTMSSGLLDILAILGRRLITYGRHFWGRIRCAISANRHRACTKTSRRTILKKIEYVYRMSQINITVYEILYLVKADATGGGGGGGSEKPWTIQTTSILKHNKHFNHGRGGSRGNALTRSRGQFPRSSWVFVFKPIWNNVSKMYSRGCTSGHFHISTQTPSLPKGHPRHD